MSTTTPKIGHALRKLADRDERVFASYPQVSRYFPAKTIDEARARLGRAIERGDGPGLVIGGPGTGKSLLLQVIAAQYHEQYDVVLPACARLCTRRALLQSILFELGLPYRSRDEGDLRLSLLDHLLSKDNCPTGLLLLIDEAQTLPMALLDELRVLTNLVRGTLPRVRLVLAGSSTLEESFADPELESFSQRLSVRCYLGPFNREETTHFICAQLAACRVKPEEIFAGDAWPAVFEATDGVPRLVNQLCDRSLVAAIDAGRSQIDRQIIQKAWADIQQLPTPWDTPATAIEAPASQMIEFGKLAMEESVESLIDDVMDDGDSDDARIAPKLVEFDTELDTSDEMPAEVSVSTSSREALSKQTSDTSQASNPFAEKYDEEEVVLDNFAAWDEMFRRDMPRAANRRDPEFSALIRAAINGTPGAKRDAALDAASTSAPSAVPKNTKGSETAAKLVEKTPRAEAPKPHLRIAELSDALTMPAQLVTSPDEQPVLIIEDDAIEPAPPKSPVRREEYRNLFSRLRSG